MKKLNSIKKNIDKIPFGHCKRVFNNSIDEKSVQFYKMEIDKDINRKFDLKKIIES